MCAISPLRRRRSEAADHRGRRCYKFELFRRVQVSGFTTTRSLPVSPEKEPSESDLQIAEWYGHKDSCNRDTVMVWA